MIRVISALAVVALLSGSAVPAQDARGSAEQRRTVLRGQKTPQPAKPQTPDLRRKDPVETQRARVEAQRERASVQSDLRRTGQPPVRQVRQGPNMPDIRSPSVGDSVEAENNAAAPAIPSITRRAPADTTAAAIPRPSRPRAAFMRLRERSGAPAFCESGAGHPLFGREWCHERGFRLGEEWERARGRDLPIERNASTRGVMNLAALREMFGDELADRIDETRTGLELPDEISARWISTPTGGSILVLSAGNRPLAELLDRDRDGLADVVWLARIR